MIRTVSAALLCAGCGGSSALTPADVASPWVAQSLDKDPDVVVAVDVRALRADPFFGKALDAVMDARTIDASRHHPTRHACDPE